MALIDQVLITADGVCRVSQDGVNVRTAPLDKVTFDSRFASVGMAVFGEVIIQRRNTAADSGKSATVLFGRTFATPPMFMFGWTFKKYQPTVFYQPRIFGFDDQAKTRAYEVDAQVFVDRVVFRNWFYPDPINRFNNETSVRWKAFI